MSISKSHINLNTAVMSVPPKLIFRRKIRQKDGVVLQDFAREIKLEVKTPNGTDGIKSELACKGKDSEPKYEYIGTDIWFSIAEFIQPEDVLSFALICPQTAFVVTSAKFWSSLYRRFINRENDLPEDLKIDCLQIGSLRRKVICALFYVYPPFIQRIKNGYELSFVEGFKYITCWHKREHNVWLFCYKLWNHIRTRTPRQHLEDSDDDEDGLSKILRKLNNVFENPHEGISLLVICSRRYIPFPNLHGADMILHSTRQLLASDLKSHNLELKFLPLHRLSPVSVDVVYPSVVKFKVIPWWHPDYKIFLYNEK